MSERLRSGAASRHAPLSGAPRIRRARTRALLAAAIALGCIAGSAAGSEQSALDVAGAHAGIVSRLWWLFTAVTAAVYLAVMAALLAAVLRGRRRSTAATDPAPGSDRRAHVAIALATGVSAAILIALTVADFVTQRRLASGTEAALRINVTGYQWWWELEYDDPDPANRFRVANELHIPVGQPVQLVLNSRDVIHSFWVPSLSGKKDLIPGRATTQMLLAQAEGRYDGQCAEFCGYQHAKMGLTVYADAPERFAAWQRAQRAASREPATDDERRGREVFIASSCALCHTIRGTGASANVGPDLTHVASRTTIAAVTLPTSEETLAAWISAPQQLKPGVRMPPTPLSPEDLGALVAYLASLE